MTDTAYIKRCITLADDTDMADFALKDRAHAELAALHADNVAQAKQIEKTTIVPPPRAGDDGEYVTITGLREMIESMSKDVS
jgi:hypothetical protein